MSSQARLFLILWLAGLAGIWSFQLVDFPSLIAKLPAAQGKPLPLPMGTIRFLSVVQPAVLVAAAVFLGQLLSPRVGLSAPFERSRVAGGSMRLSSPALWTNEGGKKVFHKSQ